MEKVTTVVRTIFYEDSLDKRKEGKYMEIICKINGDLFIDIVDESNGDYVFINLDKETAIKLSRELKKQISLMY